MGCAREGARGQVAIPARPFRLLDAMILVAALALGCGALQAIFRAVGESPYRWCQDLVWLDWFDLWESSQGILGLTLVTTPLLAMLTLALIPIRFLGPRPRFRRVRRQPGFLASLAVALAFMLAGLPGVIMWLASGRSCIDVSDWFASGMMGWTATEYGGLAVLAAWLTLFLGRRWRAEASWVDRLGRAMGLFWIVAFLVVAPTSFRQ